MKKKAEWPKRIKQLLVMGTECIEHGGMTKDEIFEDERFEGVLWRWVEMGFDKNGKSYVRFI